jgi:8-oxo-dGTP pyrophosphatase MutT (NUDIX family)
MIEKYSGKYIRVVEEQVGHISNFERVYLRDSVQVIPFKDGKIMLIHEHRVEEGCCRWKFVGGFLDKSGLSKVDVAQEELMEEAGFVASRLVEYFSLGQKSSFVIPITYFLAFDLKEKRVPNPDGDVVLDVKWFSLDDLYQRVIDGEFDFLHESSVILRLYRDWKSGKLSSF